MARPKQRKSRPAARQGPTQGAVSGSSSKEPSQPVERPGVYAEGPPAARSTPSRREKLVFAISLLAFFLWLACLAAMAIFRSK
jgi:hypothetical protein